MQKREILKSVKVNEFYRKKRNMRFKKMLIFLVLICVIFVGLGFLSKLNKFSISDIKVVGNSVLTEDEIKSAVGREISENYLFLFSKKNSFIYPKNKIEVDLAEKFKRIDTISVRRDGLRTLVVELKEHSGKYMLCDMYQEDKSAENCFFVDDVGYVFAEAPHFSGNIYFRFYGFGTSTPDNFLGKSFLNKNEFRKLIHFKELLDKNNNNPVALVLKDEDSAELIIDGLLNPRILFHLRFLPPVFWLCRLLSRGRSR